MPYPYEPYRGSLFRKESPRKVRTIALIAAALLVIVAIAAYLLVPDGPPAPADETLFSPSPDALSLGYATLNPGEKASSDYAEGWILPYKGFEDSLMAIEGVTLAIALELTNAIRDHIDFSKIYAGESLRLKFSSDGKRIEEFIYSPNFATFHTLTRDRTTGAFVYAYTRLPTETRHRIVEGTLEGTLNASLAKRAEVSTWIRQAVNNALEGMISFNTAARNGDEYRILVSEDFREGRRLPGGKVLYASYRGKIAGLREAFLYQDPDPDSAFNAHYTVEGKALASSGMRLPVDRIRVTSTFGYRIHPITGRRSMHNGVDYAGGIGDPVYAVSKGRVTFAGPDGANGNKLVIRHIDGTETFYLHLHSFAVRNGSTVKTGQIVARLGNTGRSTGPHLHFGIRRQGKWENPLRVKMIAAPTLTGERFERFKGQMREIRVTLEKTVATKS